MNHNTNMYMFNNNYVLGRMILLIFKNFKNVKSQFFYKPLMFAFQKNVSAIDE